MALNRSEVKTPAPTSEETLNVKFSAKQDGRCVEKPVKIWKKFP